MGNPIIEVKNATVILGEEVILKDVNLTVNPGDTIVLIGQSGSGKTVLLKLLAGIYTPATGFAKCHGHKWTELTTQGRHELAKSIGMQFQKSALFDEMTSLENVEYPLREHTKLSATEIHDTALQCLRQVNLEKAQDVMPHELSGGMRLRLSIARSIALKPEILFMDDPTAGLDPVTSDDMAKLILDLQKTFNSTLIIVTHDIQRAYQFAGRIFLVANKAVIETGSAEETQNHPDPKVQQFLHGWQKGPLVLE